MCDTLYKRLKNGIIYGKNSDRSPNEPNLIVFYPPKKTTEKQVNCTYISIPEVSKTNGVLLVQPSWMWGGEMGINDHGVIIGNEAVFTRHRGKCEKRLLGMDLLRLGLERGKSASQALAIIIALLEEYGQGGNCGFDKEFYYDNSFIIADKDEAYVLETANKNWVTRKIDDHYNISNRLSLNENYTNCNFEHRRFAKRNSDFLFTHFSGSKIREREAGDYLKSTNFNLRTMMAALRHHHPQDESKLYTKGSVKSVCMHKSFLGDHATASMIVFTREKINTIWLSGCSSPCLSLFIPTYFGYTIAPVFTNLQDSLNYWLKREYLHRAIYGGLIDEQKYKAKVMALQNQFIEEEENLFKGDPSNAELITFSKKCSDLEEEFVNSYQKEIELIKQNKVVLPKIWQKHSLTLGKNVFERDLKKRISIKNN